MTKRFLPYLTYLILSVLIIVFANYAHIFTKMVVDFYQYVDDHIAVFFSNSSAGLNVRHVFTLVICPLIITGIPALAYRYIKGSPMPYFLEATWVIWIILVLSKIFVR